MEHEIDCGANTVATCHSSDYVTALFRGQHVGYDHEPVQEVLWAHAVRDEPMVDRAMPEVQWGVTAPVVTNFAWVRCLRATSAAWDLVAGGWHQHLTAQQGDVLFLPLTVCQWLLTNRPTDWQQMTVVPGNLDSGLGHDAGTGLDYLSALSTGAWGRDALGSYFTSDGDMGSDERADLSVDVTGAMYMVQ